MPHARIDAGTSDAADNADCGTGQLEALQLAARERLFLVDTSASMIGDRWAGAVDAITKLVSDPRMSGVSIALSFFPTQGDNFCDSSAYTTAAVDFGELAGEPADPQEEAIADALGSRAPIGGTPLVPALDGSFQLLAQLHSGSPGRAFELVLVTDGQPSYCEDIGNNITVAVERISAARLGPAAIVTHVLGIVGFAEDNVKQLANAGGGSAYFIASEQNLTAELLKGLVGATNCVFKFPSRSAPTIELRDTSQRVPLNQVESVDQCTIGKNEWYASARGVVLCASTCTYAWDKGLSPYALCSG